jgi:phage-related minor tail protein
MADTFGLKIGIEGEREFKNALREINDSFKVLGSEMKLVDAQFDKNDKSTRALAARKEVLSRQVDEQRKKTETLRTALDNASSSFGEADKRTTGWQIKLNEAQAELIRMEKELRDNVKALEKKEGLLARVTKRLEGMQQAGERLQGIGQGLTTGITLPLAAIGTAAIASATQIQDAMAQIRAGTGATGEELQALGADLREVLKEVPQNAQEVSQAIAELNTRLGLTGEPLRELSLQMLELADLTGGQVQPLIAATTRMFGDWSVATEDQAASLDLLWKVGQTTGIQVERLAESLVQFGAPLRQMGFSLQESAALMGKWEKEGVNMELVLGSLRMAMGHFAREGIPMRQGLDETMARIRELGPGAKATSLAMEVFGARAGPDMAAAILEGRFAIDELLKQIQASPETIAGAGAETETFAEKLAILRNNATLALEPVGARLVEALTALMPQIVAVLERVAGLAEGFGRLSPAAQTTILAIAALAAALGPLLMVTGSVLAALSAVIGVLAKVKPAIAAMTAKAGALAGGITALKAVFLLLTGPIGLVIAAVSALAAGVVLLIRNWGTVGPFFARLWANVTGAFNTAVGTVRNTLQTLWHTVSERFSAMASHLRGIMSGIVAAIADPFRRAGETISGIAGRIRESLNKINPFARFSPSLVEQVRAGVAAIQAEYGKLERLQLPAVAAPAGTPSPALAATAGYHGPLIVVQNMVVRSEADIEAVSRQLYRHIQAGTRARGGG